METSGPERSLSWSLRVSVSSLGLVGEGSDRFGGVDLFFCVCPGGKGGRIGVWCAMALGIGSGSRGAVKEQLLWSAGW